MQLIGISGSLRAHSTNTTLLKAGALLTPKEFSFSIFTGIGMLPHFNPDLDLEGLRQPLAVEEFRNGIRGSTGLIFSTPEYAHGVPGTLKNALDWLVSSDAMVDKKVVIWNPSPHSTFASESLKETLTVMSAKVLTSACFTLSLQGKKLTEFEIVENQIFSETIRKSFEAFH